MQGYMLGLLFNKCHFRDVRPLWSEDSAGINQWSIILLGYFKAYNVESTFGHLINGI